MNALSDLLASKANDLFLDIDAPLLSPPARASSIPLTDIPLAPKEETPVVPQDSTSSIRALLYSIKDQLEAALRLLDATQTTTISPAPSTVVSPPLPMPPVRQYSPLKTFDGVFNGEQMVSADGAMYPVPPNYASKSKLVEGDIMKVTITPNGAYIFKQIAPTTRRNVTAELFLDPQTHRWSAVHEGKPYRVLTASVTFHRGTSGSMVSLVIPSDGGGSWGAIEHVIPVGSSF